MKSKLKMCVEIFWNRQKTNLIIVVIRKILHILIKQTKKVIGKFKDEACSITIIELVGLR